MNLHPRNKKVNQDNIDKRDRSMKVAVQQEELRLLAKILQEQLRSEILSSEFFQVTCAVKNDRLIILTQHPLYVTADTQKIFAVIEEALKSLATQDSQRVELFVRVIGEKQPYAKRSLSLEKKASGVEEAKEVGEEEVSPVLVSKPVRQVKPIVLGAALVVIAALGAGAYFLTHPCVMFECKEIQKAEELQKSSQQLMLSAKTQQELSVVQQQLEAATATLKIIPRWSLRYQKTEEIRISLSKQLEKINQIVKALQTASLAVQKNQTPTNSLEELQARQKLWRQAIAPLETVSPDSELYRITQANLFSYRLRLRSVNQQILEQEKWLKKLTTIKAVAIAAVKREAIAKSLQDLQKVQATWQVVVNSLNAIPQSAATYQEAQKLLTAYQLKLIAVRDRVIKEQIAAKTYNQAISAAIQAKNYEQQNQWQFAVAFWDQALNAANQISSNSFYYSQAQPLIEPYSKALKQAEEKLQLANSFQKARTDLDKICSAQIRICNFTLNNQRIIVRLTSEYEQAISSSLTAVNHQSDPDILVKINNHVQILHQALGIISQNTNLSLVVYNSKGKSVHTRVPISQ